MSEIKASKELILATVYTFLTILKVDKNHYKMCQKQVINEHLVQAGKSIIESEMKVFFRYIEAPNNQALFIMTATILFCGIFEIYSIDKNIVMPGFSEVFKEHMLVDSNVKFSTITLHYLMRRLRNSIQHFNYDFDGKHFWFEDINNNKVEDHFKVKLTKYELSLLIDNITFFITINCPLKNQENEDNDL